MIIVSGENIYPSEIEKYTNNLKDIKLGILSSILLTKLHKIN